MQTLKCISRFSETDKEFKTKSPPPDTLREEKNQTLLNELLVPRMSIYILSEDRVLWMKERLVNDTIS